MWTRRVIASSLLVLLAGCGSSNVSADSPVTEVSAPPSTAAATQPSASDFSAQVVAVVLDPNTALDGTAADCEHLSGDYGVFHTGAEISLRNAAGELVATTTLGPPDRRPESKRICAWLGAYPAVPDSGSGTFTAQISNWESEPLTATELRTKRLIINAGG